MSNPFSLQEKTILITGASSGIGRAIAIECSKLGANLILLARNTERLNETLSLMYGNTHNIHSIDLTDNSQLEALIPALPQFDGIVHSAGILRTSPAKFIENSDFSDIFSTNVYVPMKVNSYLLENKKINKGASIVFLSSIAANLLSQKGNSLYGASKAAIIAYSRVLANELSIRKIRSNCISPGMVETDLLENFNMDSEQLEEDKQKYPLGYGLPQDVAYAVIYLLSDASRWVTGSNIILDGGRTLQ